MPLLRHHGKSAPVFMAAHASQVEARSVVRPDRHTHGYQSAIISGQYPLRAIEPSNFLAPVFAGSLLIRRTKAWRGLILHRDTSAFTTSRRVQSRRPARAANKVSWLNSESIGPAALWAWQQPRRKDAVESRDICWYNSKDTALCIVQSHSRRCRSKLSVHLFPSLLGRVLST